MLMMKRATVTAESDDLETLKGEAKRQATSLASLMGQILAEKAAELRSAHPPRIGIGRSGRGIARESSADESRPARTPFRG